MSNSKRKCKGCNRYLRQDKHDWRKAPIGWFHTLECQVVYARKQVQNEYESDAKKARAKHRENKAKAKGLGHWKGVTQDVVNAYARARDKGMPCISCHRYEYDLSTDALHGSVWDGGHYRAVGSMPSLRFDLRNINGQCRKCNGFEGGNIHMQREGIVARYGQARLDWLDGPHEPKHYTIEQLARLRKIINKRGKRYGAN